MKPSVRLDPSSIKVKVARVLELIVQEAGGLVTDFAGNHGYGYQESSNILVGNPKIHAKMLSHPAAPDGRFAALLKM